MDQNDDKDGFADTISERMDGWMDVRKRVPRRQPLLAEELLSSELQKATKTIQNPRLETLHFLTLRIKPCPTIPRFAVPNGRIAALGALKSHKNDPKSPT